MSQDQPPDEVELFREPEHDEEPAPPKRDPRVIAIAGAKGGVGKTTITANLAVFLASIGRKVVVVDADGTGANVHTVLGMAHPSEGPVVPPWLEGGETREPARDDALDETPIPNLSLLHAGIDEPAAGHRRRATRRGLLGRLRRLDAEYIVVDLGAGTQRAILDFWLDADQSLFVTLPEPTAVDGTYRFIRAAFMRALRRRMPDAKTRATLLQRVRAMGNAPPPMDLARRLEAEGDPLSDLVRAEMAEFSFRFVLNQTRVRADLELGEAMSIAVRRRLGVRIDYAGYVDHDDAVWTCLRMKRPVLVESPGTKASKSIEKLTRRVLAIDAGKTPRSPERRVPPESHHDLLEVDRGATDEDIRRSYKRVREIYAHDSLCCYGLFRDQEIEGLRARLEEAYDVLLDSARRRPYELSVFPTSPEPMAAPRPLGEDVPRPPPPIITPDTEFTGALLKAVRESQGIDLLAIAQRTKIGIGYLQAIEDESYAALPAPVYVRGFVTEVAKFLQLDTEQVPRTFVRRYKRWLDDRERVF